MTMSTEDMVFIFCSNGVFIPWLALLIAPKWKYTTPITHAAVLISCAVYTFYFGAHLLNNVDGVMNTYADMGTIDGLQKMFSDRNIILPAWVHYLAFDLLTGHTLVKKNAGDPKGLPQLAMAPVLVLTCMAGPVGVLLYTIARFGSDLIGGKVVPKVNEKLASRSGGASSTGDKFD